MRGGSLSDDQPGLPYSNLMVAVESGDEDAATRAIEAGSSVDAINRYGLRPIHIAAACGHTHLVRLLVANGASFSAGTDEGDTVFEFLITSAAAPDALKETLALMPNLDFRKVRNSTGETALHLAANRRLPQMCQTLLDAGHDPNQEDYAKKTPLHSLSMDRGSGMDLTRQTIELLLRSGANPDLRCMQKRTAFEQACAGGPGSVVDDFLGAAGHLLQTQGRAGLELAARFDNAEAARALLQHGLAPAGTWATAEEFKANGVLHAFREHFHQQELETKITGGSPAVGKPRI